MEGPLQRGGSGWGGGQVWERPGPLRFSEEVETAGHQDLGFQESAFQFHLPLHQRHGLGQALAPPEHSAALPSEKGRY